MSQREKEWQHLREMMEHMLQEPGGTLGGSIVWHPPTDVYETESEFVVRVEVAAVRRDDIKVLTTEREIVIRGIRRDSVPPGKKHFYKMEITMGPFERRVPLPRKTRVSDVQATYRNGILEVRCRKSRGAPPGEVTIEVL